MSFSIIAIVAADIAGAGLGTYCSVCPVGFLEITVASHSLPWKMLPWVLAVTIAIFLLGKFFCSWFCPTTLTGKVLGARQIAISPAKRFPALFPYIILGVSVVLSFIVKFPVFCLICPIGLFFGFIFAVLKLFNVFEPSMALIIFPLMLIAELVLFRKWCSIICPISGFMMLINKIPGYKFRLQSDSSTCLLKDGITTEHCADNCQENLRITKGDNDFIERCTSCMECSDSCPAKSISFKLIRHKLKSK